MKVKDLLIQLERFPMDKEVVVKTLVRDSITYYSPVVSVSTYPLSKALDDLYVWNGEGANNPDYIVLTNQYDASKRY